MKDKRYRSNLTTPFKMVFRFPISRNYWSRIFGLNSLRDFPWNARDDISFIQFVLTLLYAYKHPLCVSQSHIKLRSNLIAWKNAVSSKKYRLILCHLLTFYCKVIFSRLIVFNANDGKDMIQTVMTSDSWQIFTRRISFDQIWKIFCKTCSLWGLVSIKYET